MWCEIRLQLLIRGSSWHVHQHYIGRLWSVLHHHELRYINAIPRRLTWRLIERRRIDWLIDWLIDWFRIDTSTSKRRACRNQKRIFFTVWLVECDEGKKFLFDWCWICILFMQCYVVCVCIGLFVVAWLFLVYMTGRFYYLSAFSFPPALISARYFRRALDYCGWLVCACTKTEKERISCSCSGFMAHHMHEFDMSDNDVEWSSVGCVLLRLSYTDVFIFGALLAAPVFFYFSIFSSPSSGPHPSPYPYPLGSSADAQQQQQPFAKCFSSSNIWMNHHIAPNGCIHNCSVLIRY